MRRLAIVLGLVVGTSATASAKPRRGKGKGSSSKAKPAPSSAATAKAVGNDDASAPPTDAVESSEEFGPKQGNAKARSLHLGEAVRSALAHHPAVVRQRIDTRIAELAIEQEKARYVPVITGSGRARYERLYNELADDPSQDINPVNTAALAAGIQGMMRSGATYSLSAEGARRSEPNANAFLVRLTPRWTSMIAGRWVQPLKRGAGFAANGARIERERITVELRTSEEREQLVAVALNVVSSYWALVLRREELRILETNVAAAVTLEEIVARRVRAGQDPQSSLGEAALAVTERRRAVEGARVAIVDAERELLGHAYLNRSGLLKLSEVPVPVEALNSKPVEVTFDDELETALENRPEAARIKQEVRLARLESEIADNSMKYRLDLYAEGGLLGLGGRNNTSPGDAQPPDILIGGVERSAINIAKLKSPFLEVGFQVEIPFDNSGAVAASRQAKARIKRAQAQDIETQISLDVRAAVQRLRIASRSLSVASEAHELAQKNVAAKQLRYEGGGATLFDVTLAQDKVAQALARVALAKAQLAVARANLAAARGTLLSQFQVDIASEAKRLPK